MPSRILREGLLDSDAIGSVSLEAETLFVRLLLLADDFGRYDGRPPVICRRAFVNRRELDDDKCASRLDELMRAGLVLSYFSNGKPFITIPRFNQRMRAKRSKFPAPPWESNQELSDDSVRQKSVERPSYDCPPRTEAEAEAETNAVTDVSAFTKFWELYPKKRSKGSAEIAWGKLNPDAVLLAKILEGLRRAAASLDWVKDNGRYIPYPATWLGARGWEDDVSGEGSSANIFQGALCDP